MKERESISIYENLMTIFTFVRNITEIRRYAKQQKLQLK